MENKWVKVVANWEGDMNFSAENDAGGHVTMGTIKGDADIEERFFFSEIHGLGSSTRFAGGVLQLAIADGAIGGSV